MAATRQPPAAMTAADLMARELVRLRGDMPLTAPPDTPIRVLAQMMLDAHIHRIIVVDQERRPIGMVSTTDLLAAMARGDGL